MSQKVSAALSARGQSLLGQGSLSELMREVSLHQKWDAETNPSGMLSVAGATNLLMDDFYENFCEKNLEHFDPSKYTRYGPETGSIVLKAALAAFFNHYFHPANPVTGEEVLVTNGSSSLIENLAWSVFDEGDAIILPTPTYALFPFNLQGRPGVKVLRVPMEGIKDQFHEDFVSEVVREFKKTYDEATSNGIKVKGLLLCNPNNPMGRCYSKVTILEIAKFCKQHNLHLISDEVYAMSSYNNQAETRFDTFTSALTLSGTEVEDKNIHVLYGVSKDFALGGMRLGFLVSRNEKLREIIEQLGMYSWVTSSSDAFFSRFISDFEVVDQYLKLFKDRCLEANNHASSLFKKHSITLSPANAGLFVWVDLRHYLKYFEGSDGGKVELDLCHYLIKKGIFLSPGEMYGSTEPGFFRFTTSVGKPMLEAAILRLSESLEILASGGGLEKAVMNLAVKEV